ncbi:MAG: site-2 protease family protein [Patescibacteria group bacterium]
MDLLIFLAVLVLLIIVHEFGHFLAAKKAGVRVDEFGIGFPPRLFGFRKGETEYTLNLIPFGGFVKIFGEDPDAEALLGPDKERSLARQSKRVRAAVIAAGVFCNFLLAWVLFSFGYAVGFPVSADNIPRGGNVLNQELLITGISEGSPAEDAGLRHGDVITALRASEKELAPVSPALVRDFISSHEGVLITVSYERDGTFAETALVPKRGIVGEEPAIGIAMDMVGFVRLPLHQAFWEGGKMTVSLSLAIVSSLATLLAGVFDGTADVSHIAGPIGIVGLVGNAADLGAMYLLGFVAFISVNLAVLNLIPFPALDGGRLFFLLIEAVKGSPVRPAIANAAHAVGFAILIIVMLLVTYSDIVKLIAN